jgi:two-component system, OmpR family, sensor histidine kinase CreC
MILDRPVKIRTAIYGVYVAASAAGLVVLMAFILHDVRLRYVESMRRTLNDTAAVLATLLESSSSATADGDDLGAAWRENLPALSRAAGALRVYVTDARGVVVFDANGGRDVGRDYAFRPELQEYFDKTDESRGNGGTVDGELRVTAPVKKGAVTVGFVGVARPLSTIAEAVLRARLRLLVGATLIAAVMTAAGWWIASKLTHSLERLTQYALAVRDGRRGTPPQSRATEITALVSAFEEMRVALEGKAHVERYTQALAHELKAPLSAIRGAAELLGEELPPEDRAKFLANLRAESDRMQRVVERLLELSALEARDGRVDFAEIDLSEVVREVVASADGIATQRRISFVVPEGVTLRVKGEQFLLAQAVGNLVQNALEFSPEDSVVTVSVHAEGAHAVVVVEDNGPGVPAFALEKVFDRFYSLPRPDTGRKSSGLGLSIVQEIARLHGGEVTLENRVPRGVRAALSLPLG